MASVIPPHWQAMTASGAAQRELETLALLARNLPEDYTVFHGIHWTRIEQGTALFGEIDFAIVSPGGRLLVIEQKSGFLDETAAGLVKRYGNTEKKVALQLNRNIHGLQSRFAANGQEKLEVDLLLYCPDHVVKRPEIAGIDPSRIVDHGRREQLVAIIRHLVPLDAPSPKAARVKDFLAQVLALVPEIGALAGAVDDLHTRLSGGLATWGRCIDCDPFRVRVIGTAGSGKSQLALAVLRDARAAGRRALYVCYNRPLADHMALLAPPGAQVATYHQLADRILRSQDVVIDFSQPEAFRRVEEGFASATPGAAWQYDELVVDEGQDFRAAWLPTLLGLLAPEGRAWWLEDPQQNLYERPPLPLPGWVTLRSATNYRSPRAVLAGLGRLGLLPTEVEGGSPLGGAEVEVLTYTDSRGMIEATKKALTQGLAAGFKRPQIAVVTYRGREHSQLLGFDQVGPHRLRSFSGNYDLLGNPIFGTGDILTETVYRFKGQAAPCIVFTEIDFEAADARALRKLFVGATRASMKLLLVMSERAAGLLAARTDGRDPDTSPAREPSP